MERRAGPRKIMRMDASLRPANAEPIPFRLQNICRTGAFLTSALPLGGMKESTLEALLLVDDPVTITLHGGTQEQPIQHQIHARVVRVSGNGVGVRFQKISEQTLQYLEQAAVAFVPHDSHKPFLGDSWSLIRRLIEETRRYLLQQLPSFLSQAIEHLFEQADKARNNSDQMTFLGAARLLARHQAEIQNRMLDQVSGQIQQLDRPDGLIRKNQKEDIDSIHQDDMEIVEHDVFDEWVEINSIVSNTESEMADLLDELNQQLSLLTRQQIDTASNPLGPGNLLECLRQALAGSPLEQRARPPLFRSFQQTVLREAKQLYVPIIDLLRDAGFNALQASHWRRSHRRAPPVRTPPGRTLAPRGGMGEHVRRASAVDGRSMEEVRGQQLLSALGKLQTYSGHSTLERVLAALQQEMPAGTEVALGWQEEQTLDLTSKLLSAINQDSLLDSYTAGWLKNLEIPLAKAALLDPDVLENHEHPVREVLNQLERLSLAVSDEQLLSSFDQQLQATIDQVTEQINRDFHDDLSLFDTIQQNISPLIQTHDKLYARNVKRVLQAHEGRIELQEAKESVARELNTRLTDLQVPECLISLLDEGWRELLALTHLRHGPESEEWRRRITVVDEIQALLTTAQLKESQIKRRGKILIDEVKDGLSQVSFDTVRSKQIIDKLKKSLTTPLHQRDQHLVEFKPYPQALSPEPPPEDQWTHLARQLKVGDWIISRFEDRRSRPLTLVWTDDQRNHFIFVNGQGMKALDTDLATLASHLRHSTISILEDGDLPLMDRAMHSMLKRTHQQVAHRASHDELTGQYNRRQFILFLEHALTQSLREGREHILCLINLDGFRAINEACGHEGGDRALSEIADLLQNIVRRQAVLARLSEHQFGLLFENCISADGVEEAEFLRRALMSYRFDWQAQRLPINTSIGLAAIDRQSSNVNELLIAAEHSCQQARLAGGNHIQLTQTSPTSGQAQEMLQAITVLDDAMAAGRLQLLGQEIAVLNGKGHSHYEVLLRIIDESGNALGPQKFIQAAEQYGRIVDLDRWVVDQVLRMAAEAGPRLGDIGGLSINLSGQSIGNARQLAFILDRLGEAQFPTGAIAFEVTETAAMNDVGQAQQFISRIKATGSQFLLDDFGTGFSSYAYLRNLPVDFIKIDGCFIKEIHHNPVDQAMVKSICEMGHFLGKKIVAEYAENEEVLAVLREINIDYAQGYGISRPRPLEEILFG